MNYLTLPTLNSITLFTNSNSFISYYGQKLSFFERTIFNNIKVCFSFHVMFLSVRYWSGEMPDLLFINYPLLLLCFVESQAAAGVTLYITFHSPFHSLLDSSYQYFTAVVFCRITILCVKPITFYNMADSPTLHFNSQD